MFKTFNIALLKRQTKDIKMTVAKNIAMSPRSNAFKMRIANKYAIRTNAGKTFLSYSFDDGSRLFMQKCSRNLSVLNISHSLVDIHSLTV